jgi:CO/xanthine dehydrogenase Mo-binding subunit
MLDILGTVGTRRHFVKGGLLVTFGLAIGFAPAAGAQGIVGTKTVAIDEVDGFMAIGADGHAVVYCGKVDLGTGIRTALTQIAAEELDLPIERITVIQGDTALTPDQGPTYASWSIQIGGMQLRQAAATARKALLEMSAQRLGVPAAELSISNGTVTGAGKSISYGELVGGRTLARKVDKDAPLKDPATYTIVGKSVPRLDIRDKATGRFTYMHDFRIAGMLHGRVVRPLAIGAKLESVDKSSVKDVPGVVAVVREHDFLGVVATTEWGAIQAARKLKASWSAWEGLPDQAKLWEHVRGTKIVKDEVTSNVGNSAEAMAKAPKRLAATYDFAIHTHGSLGPSCAVAEFADSKLTCWTASQATHNLRKQLAQMLSLPAENVRCIYVEGSGCYGRNGHEDAAGDAALLAKAVGRPVRVQWSRSDEHGWDPKGPPTLIDLRAAMDASGNVTAWTSEFFIANHTAVPPITVPLLPATLSGRPAESHLAPAPLWRNSAIPYRFANVMTVCHRLETTPFRSSWIRTPGRMQNTFANECFMDELAAAASVDPLEFRLRYFDPDDKRGLDTLERLAKLAKWERRALPQRASGKIVRGRGMSYVSEEVTRTYVGAVAEVEVDRESGAIRVQRFVVAHDCGQIINPDGLKNQIEGNVIQTMSRTLLEELTFDRSAVTSLHWGTYPILSFPDVPEVEIELIDRPREKPSGAGEPTAAVVPSAISNAVFDATGARLRSVPFTPAKVKAAIDRT